MGIPSALEPHTLRLHRPRSHAGRRPTPSPRLRPRLRRPRRRGPLPVPLGAGRPTPTGGWAQPEAGTGAPAGPPPWPPAPGEHLAASGRGATPGASASRARVLVAIGAVAVVLITATGVLYVRSRPAGPTYPKQWDSRVTDIVAFDEKERGLTYKHPVEIEFLSEEDFKADVTSSADELSAEDRQKIDDETAAFRALGLIDGGVDLFEEQNDLSGGGTLAYYSSETKKVRVRGTEMTPALRVTLAHELTHALQDQYFDLDASEKKLETDGEKTAFRAAGRRRRRRGRERLRQGHVASRPHRLPERGQGPGRQLRVRQGAAHPGRQLHLARTRSGPRSSRR